MCGIVGIYYKSPALEARLGEMLAAMLLQMSDRGPDSAGVAVYRQPAAAGQCKITLQGGDDADWDGILQTIRGGWDAAAMLTPLANHAVAMVRVDGRAEGRANGHVNAGANGHVNGPTNGAAHEAGDGAAAAAWLETHIDGVNITSIGRAIEIYKEKGAPAEVMARFEIEGMHGSHALGHTRMATESAVTTEHSHPFSTGLDLCLVHNGSLSNHNRWRDKLRAEGIRFQTDNDSEVAAGYLTWRLSQGATLRQAMQAALMDLDGFYTFAVGARDGFAVMRDRIACKPAILAETDEWVAMASEYRAIAQLPGSADAKLWEPEPATIYNWQREP